MGLDLRPQTVREEQPHNACRDAAAVECHLEMWPVGVDSGGRIAQVLRVCHLEERAHLRRPAVLESRRSGPNGWTNEHGM